MDKKPTILITGANGQLGQELKAASSAFPGFNLIFFPREDLSVQAIEQVRNAFADHSPQFCINCAAYTAVDKAETEKEQVFMINAEAAGVLATVCKEYHTKFIHLSTDYVFDGLGTTPYKENGITNPQNVYGASKLEGEKLAVQFDPRTVIIRTSWLYSTFGKNFVKTMLRLMAEKNEISIVNDQTGSPTYAADLARALLQVIASGKWKPGTYHYSNEGAITWFDFAVAIKEMTNSKCSIRPIPTAGYETPAKRPVYSVLDTSKITAVYGIQIKYWKDSLRECLSGKLSI